MREWVRYALSVALYIAISLVTKRLLTWNIGLLYFVVTLEAVPRAFARVRHRGVGDGG